MTYDSSTLICLNISDQYDHVANEVRFVLVVVLLIINQTLLSKRRQYI